MNISLMEQRLRHFPNVVHVAVNGDGRHFQITLVSADFEGKNKLARQRMVYTYLGEWLVDGSLHAVELETLTPQEWE